MELKKYLVVSYGILVKAGKWALEKDGDKPMVPEEYTLAVAEYLATQGQSVVTQ